MGGDGEWGNLGVLGSVVSGDDDGVLDLEEEDVGAHGVGRELPTRPPQEVEQVVHPPVEDGPEVPRDQGPPYRCKSPNLLYFPKLREFANAKTLFW